MAWTNLTLTVDGRNALNQAQFDNQLNFKSIVVGDGTAPANFRTQKKLVHQLYELTDLKIDKTDSGCTLTADFPKVDYDYYFREVGIIVTTKEGDKLYVYDNCGEDAQYIVSSTGAETTQKRLRLALVISDVENITISEPSILYVAYDDYEQTILELNQTKVDKVEGKGLSTNDYTNADKNKLSGIAEGAEVNVQSDWNVSNSNSDAYIKNKPQSMKNPTSLNISLNGVSQGAYDGSSQKNVNVTAENIGADSSGTAATKVSEHNSSEKAHADIRNLITTLTNTVDGKVNKAGDTMTGTLYTKNLLVSSSAKGGGTDGYIHFVRIEITGQYADRVIAFKIGGRQRGVTNISIKFSGDTANPRLYKCWINGDCSYKIYIVKSNEDIPTWDLYAQKFMGWGEVSVLSSHYTGSVKVTYPGTFIAEKGEDWIEATIETVGNAFDSDTIDGKHASDFVNKAGDTMTGTLNSSLSTVSFIDGNAGRAIINSTAGAGTYTMLDRLKSTNGYFTDGVWEGKRVFSYTPKTTVDSSVNEVKYQLVLLDEVGNSNFPGLISASRGNFKGDIMTTNNRSDTLNITVPCSGRIDDNIIFPQHLSNYKTFLGSCLDHNKKWWGVISVRHANGFGDGQNYGMYLRSEMTGTGSHGGSLLWNKEMGNASGWLGERVLLDSKNCYEYCASASWANDIGDCFCDGAAITAMKLGDYESDDSINFVGLNVGSLIQPVYFSDGVPKECKGAQYISNYNGGQYKILINDENIVEADGAIMLTYEQDDSSQQVIINAGSIDFNDFEYSRQIIYSAFGMIGKENPLEFTYQFYNKDKKTIYFDGDSFYPFYNKSSNLPSNIDLGKNTTNGKWRNIYASNGTIQTSDRTKKTNINSLKTQKAQAFIYGLNPVSYKMIDGTSGRTHYGFIAQDIEKLMNTLHMDSKDFAGFIKSPKKIIKYEDENGIKLENPIEEVIENEYDYALRYDEFIAPLIKVVQEQQKTIEQQQRMIEQQQIVIENQQKEIEQIKKDISKIYSSI